MFKHLLHYWLFAFTLFAAAAPAVGGGDGGGGADGTSNSEGLSNDSTDTGESADSTLSEDLGGDDLHRSDDEPADTDHEAQQKLTPEDKETGDFKGLVSKRLLALKKEAPELAGVFQKYPKVQEQVEAAFRRDMAYRELYPTVAEARSMREQFPNGMADVEQLMGEIGEVEQLDRSFYNRDPQGNYAGHSQLIQNWFQDDPEAMRSMFRTVPKEWARLDPDGYNEVMSNIVGATLVRGEIPEWLTELRDAAKTAKQDHLATSLDKLLRWSQGFLKTKAAPSEEERRLQAQRDQFKRETGERQQADFNRFKTTFFSESNKQQRSIVQKHPAIAEMLSTKALSEDKKKEIVGKVQTRIREFLKTSRGFMSKLRPAYNSGNLEECLKLEKAQWSYPWVLNKFVRQVMAEETPSLVRQNRERTRGAAPQSQRQPVQRQQQQQAPKHTKPYQDSQKVWRKADGSRLTTAEILRGVHLQA